MSDFSSINIPPDFALLPAKARNAGYFQSKDLPDDPAYGACIGGEVEADGQFVRTDSNVRRINPNLNGWIGLTGVFAKVDLIARLEAGKIVEMREAKGEKIHDHSPLRGAYWSPNTWQTVI